jgi:hypothetical protein
MGGEFHRGAMNRRAANYPGGQINFNANESGFGFSSFLLGYPDYAETPEGNALTLPVQNQWAMYVLDDWKITPRLTLNWGLRYDHIGTPYDRGGYWRTPDLTKPYTTPQGTQIPTVVPGVLGTGAAVALWPTNHFLMPRLGIAYRWDKWVIRTGAGWFDNSTHFNNYTILNLAPPYSAGQSFYGVTDNFGTTPVTGGGQTFNLTTRIFRPGSPILVMGPDLFAGSATHGAEQLFYVQPDRKNDNHWQWSFDIQRELPLGTAFTLGYVGSKTSNASSIMGYWNVAQPSPNNNFQSRRPIQQVYDPLQTPNIQTVSTIQAIINGLNNYYQGVTVSVDKRFSHGLAYGFNYTYSLANGQSSGPQDGPYGQNPQNWADGKGPLPFSQRHRAVGNFVYELPYRKDGKGVLGAIAGGWQANGIITLASGYPFSITQGDDLNTGKSADGGQVRPDRIADGRLSNQSRQLWFDPNAFQRVTCNIPSRPDLCHWGSAGPGIFTGPSARNLDLSMSKNFRFTESVRLQFRMEAFNAINRPWFGNPTGIGFISNNSIKPDASRMGEIRSLTAPMRTVQLGLKVYW